MAGRHRPLVGLHLETGAINVGKSLFGRVEQLVGSADCKSVVVRPWGFESLLSHTGL